MHTPEQPRLHFNLIRRVLMWTGMALLLFTGLLSTSFGGDAKQAWADALATCPGNDTIPDNLSIPIAPDDLYLVYGGAPAEYDVSVCKEPTAPVEVIHNVDGSAPIAVEPPSLTFTTVETKSFSVSLAASHPRDEPFTFVITHTATSDDPEFDYGSLNVPVVTVYYSPPVAVDDTAIAPHGQSIEINVVENDVDRLGEGLTLPAGAIISAPSHGSASVSGAETVLYTPSTGFVGFDSFVYQVVDAKGNTDTATVLVRVAASGTTNPQIKPGSPVAENVLEFLSEIGIIKVNVPPLDGVPADAEVLFTFADVSTPQGNVNAPPVPLAAFSGIAFRFEIFVDGEPLDPASLSGPVTVEILLPDDFVEGLDGRRVLVLVWDGSGWKLTNSGASSITRTTGEDELPYSFSTTQFGEFAIFSDRVIFVTYLEANLAR